MDLDWTTLALQIINFLVLVWLLKHFLYRPVLDVIARRQRSIEQALDDARDAEKRAQALRRDYESKLDDLSSAHTVEIGKLADEVAAERVRRFEQLDAEIAAERERQEALTAKHADETRRHVEADAREAAMGFVARLLERLAGPDLDSRLVELLIEDMQALPHEQIVALRKAATDGATQLELTTARPLADGDEARLLQALADTLECGLQVTRTIDQNLQSGLRVGIGPWLLAASLADELSFFRCGPDCDD